MLDREFWMLADEQSVEYVPYSEPVESLEQIWPDKTLVKTANFLFLMDEHGHATLVAASHTNRAH